MSKYIVDINGDIEGDYKIVKKYVEPKIGHWTVHPKGIYSHLICDNCLSGAPYDCETNYCPNCGAKMERIELS